MSRPTMSDYELLTIWELMRSQEDLTRVMLGKALGYGLVEQDPRITRRISELAQAASGLERDLKATWR